LNVLPPAGARTETAEFAKVNFDHGPNGTAFEQRFENSKRVILATIGARNNGLPTIDNVDSALSSDTPQSGVSGGSDVWAVGPHRKSALADLPSQR
jgi:hypothetical protein